jgi:hypothetical protein
MARSNERPAVKAGRRDLSGKSDHDLDSSLTVRSQVLARRGVPFHRAGLIGMLAFGEVAA